MNTPCNNCGRVHEGTLIETFIDGVGKPIDIVVCDNPQPQTKPAIDNQWKNI